MKGGKYIVVSRIGFMPYFLYAWNDGPNGKDGWDYLRARASVFDGSAARRIANQPNARRQTAPLPVSIEVAR